MPGLESTLAAAEVGMLSSLDYRLPQVSNFVTDRKEVTYYPLAATNTDPSVFGCSRSRRADWVSSTPQRLR